MAKRFTDTDKWKKSWFRKLPPRLKCAWFFICDSCDHAGVFSLDMDSLVFHVGEEISEDELFKVFKLTRLDAGAVFVQSFIDFQ